LFDSARLLFWKIFYSFSTFVFVSQLVLPILVFWSFTPFSIQNSKSSSRSQGFLTIVCQLLSDSDETAEFCHITSSDTIELAKLFCESIMTSSIFNPTWRFSARIDSLLDLDVRRKCKLADGSNRVEFSHEFRIESRPTLDSRCWPQKVVVINLKQMIPAKRFPDTVCERKLDVVHYNDLGAC
jgi:hypothetical protein